MTPAPEALVLSGTAALLAEAKAWRDEDPDPTTRAELDALVSTVAAVVSVTGNGDVPPSPGDGRPGPGAGPAAGAGAGGDVRASAGPDGVPRSPDLAGPGATGAGGDAAGALAELRDRFAGRLEFGTAGLRGAMAAGPNRMNEAVVVRATAGLAAWLTEQGHGGEPVIVGFDARHHSSRYASAAASVLAAAGFPVLLADRPVPTPVLAFGVLHRECCAGIQVTASHNPPADNGYKVYVADGAQIVPPADTEISAAIDAVGPLPAVPRAPESPLITPVGDELVDAYVAGAVDTALRSPDRPKDVSVVYTPMHGVGRDVLLPAFAAAGFPAPDVVPEQGDPDPDFPTVAFPNPEEPGALDLALARAATAGADVVIANDPDADRLAIAVPRPAADGGGWRPLSGDETGAVLADWLLAHGSGADRLVATTIVSSSLLSRLAEARGVRYAETLTGFKWIMRAALGHPELAFVYGYEEALGSCVGTLVHDKDGITAALAFAELVAAEKARGRSVLDRLDDLHRELGVHATGQRSVVVPGAEGQARMREIVDGLVASPPATLAGRPVTSVDDLRPGGDLPPTDAVVLRADGVRLIVRPSGTEPKLKCYAEAVLPPPVPDLPPARAEARTTVTTLLDEALTLAT